MLAPRGARADGTRDRVDHGFFVGMTQMVMRAGLSRRDELVLAAYYTALTQAHVTAVNLYDDDERGLVVESFCDWPRLGTAVGLTAAVAMEVWRDARRRVALEIARARP